MDRSTETRDAGKQKGARGVEGKRLELPGLANLSGSVRLDIHDEPAATLHVENGRVWAGQPESQADAIAVLQDRADFDRILAGELNPVVAAIQGRLLLRGEPELATRLIGALYAAKPFKAKSREGEG
jgi:hypothetical protein